jgi:hypothetical protein
MKRAKLPTGEILEFPDNTHDNVVDSTVKKHLNVVDEPQGPTPEQVTEMAARGIIDAVQMIAASNAEVVAAVNAASERTSASIEQLAGVIGAIQFPANSTENLEAAVRDGIRQVVDALLTPKKLVTEKGKPVGVEPAYAPQQRNIN